jgi:hypothetical protein
MADAELLSDLPIRQVAREQVSDQLRVVVAAKSANVTHFVLMGRLARIPNL